MRFLMIATFSLAVALLAGCGKKAEQPAPSPAPEAKSSSVTSLLKDAPPANQAAPVQGAQAPDAAAAAAETPAAEPTDKIPTAGADPGKTAIQTPSAIKITEAMQRFLERNNRLPKDFNELVASKMLPSMPPAPPGKKYALDRKTLQVMVVDQ